MYLLAPIIAAGERLFKGSATRIARHGGNALALHTATSPPYVVGVTGHVESGAARCRVAVSFQLLDRLLFEA